MSGKTGGVSALAAADATRVKANRNPDFNKVLESRKNADIIEYLNSNGDEEQKKRDFQVSFSSVKLKSAWMKISVTLNTTRLHVFVSSLIFYLSNLLFDIISCS